MKLSLFVLGFWLAVISVTAGAAPGRIQGMYVNTFGDAKGRALIFIHGGPAYNSWDFEYSTAPILAQHGYFVVVYDERGQGRSEAVDPRYFNYTQYSDDLKTIIDTLHLQHPVLIGHSHGGPIAIHFDQHYPGVASRIVLVSAPIQFWNSFHSLFENCARRYTAPADHEKLDRLTYLYASLFSDPAPAPDQMAGLVSSSFIAAIGCKVYRTSHPTAEEKAVRSALATHALTEPLSGQTTSVGGFLLNENYLHFDGVAYVAEHRDRFRGIYGDEDGLFTPLELSVIRNSLQRPGEAERYFLLKGASHGVYLDQQTVFIETLETLLRDLP